MTLKNATKGVAMALALIAGQATSQTVSSDIDPTQTQSVERGIVHIAGDLYRVQNGFHYTVYMVTPEGIILADPISTKFATWLKDELATRHPGLPVRYVIYSHHHFDHGSGAAVFDDTATLVAHENFEAARQWDIDNWPAQFIVRDVDGNGSLEKSEAAGLALARFPVLDADKNDVLTSEEILANVRLPEMTYADRMTITLGGKTVELVHPGANHAPDMTVLIFPEERAMFGVDFVNVGRLAIGFPGTGNLDEWVDSIKATEALDFDIVVPGHSRVGTKAEFTAYREYFEDLKVAIDDAIASGMSAQDVVASDALMKYSDLPNYDPWRNRNIIGAYRAAISK